MDMTRSIANRYTMVQPIGHGGMGDVYLARDDRTGETVAIKVLKPELVEKNQEMVERFVREGELLGQLNHPNIVRVLDSVQDDENHCIVMEFVGGGSLRDLLKLQPQLPLKRVLRIALELSDALTRTHHLKVIHRDIKAANVLLADDGTPRLTDFGIARIGATSGLTHAGMVFGTLSYLSPEAANGDELDARSDIWSFGVLLYEMLTGHLPFEGENAAQTIASIMSKPVPDPSIHRADLPESVKNLVNRMLAKNKDERIGSARQVGAELESILEELETGTRRMTTTMTVLERDTGEDTTIMDDLPTATPSSPLPTAPTHNLPVQPTAFVGRGRELGELNSLLADSSIRLVTVLAPGGMGKTRLSVEAATHQLENFEHGVWFVALAPVLEPELILSAIIEALPLSLFGQEDPKTQLLNYLREKKLLLVMDNFEHLISGAGLVADIMQAAPGVKILASSRERLNLRGETVFALDGMDLPDFETPEDAEKYEAIQLFIQSARQVQPDFELTQDNLRDVVRICRLVYGMPLGIELSAAWVEVLPLDEIIEEIEGNLDFLETELRDMPERHRSIRAVFQYSWNLITDDEREVFTKLSVFRGGFTREAAKTVADASIRVITTLVNKSLVHRLDSGRYQVHELLRQYAEEHLCENAEFAEDIVARHCQYYLSLISKPDNELYGSAADEHLQLLLDEIDNIRAAWMVAIRNCQLDGIEAAIGALSWYYDSQSLYQQGTENLQKAADVLDKASLSYGRILIRISWMQSQLARSQKWLDMALEGLDIAREYDDTAEIAYALNIVSYVAMWLDDFDMAKEYGERAIELYRNAGIEWGIGRSLSNLGYVYFLEGDYTTACEYLREGYEVAFRINLTIGAGYAANNFGEVLQAMGQFEEAHRMYKEAYDAFKKLGNRRGVAFSLNNLASINLRRVNYQLAWDQYARAFEINKEIGDRVGIGHSLSALAQAAFMANDYDGARDLFQQALDIRREMNDTRGIADSLQDLGYTELIADNIEMAQDYIEQSLKLREASRDMRGRANALTHLSVIYQIEGRHEEALTILHEALELSEQMGDVESKLENYFHIGWVKLDQGYYEAVRDMMLRYIDEYDQPELRSSQSMFKTLLGFAYVKLENFAEAESIFAEVIEGQAVSKNYLFLLPILLGVAAVRYRQGQPERALEILTVISCVQSGMLVMLKPALAELRSLLVKTLTPDDFKAIQEHASQRSVRDLTREIFGKNWKPSQ